LTKERDSHMGKAPRLFDKEMNHAGDEQRGGNIETAPFLILGGFQERNGHRGHQEGDRGTEEKVISGEHLCKVKKEVKRLEKRPRWSLPVSDVRGRAIGQGSRKRDAVV